MSGLSENDKKTGYNERLFGGNSLRSYLHNARFVWFRNTLKEQKLFDIDMIEIGCFDGRLLEFCPKPPKSYEGFDADWEGGLSDGQKKYKDHESWHFCKAEDASALKKRESRSFNVGASMETIEHIPPELVDGYLKELARVIDGYFLVTVPNEKGIVFFFKYFIMKHIMRSAQDYTMKEVIAATFGQMHKVERCQHKGFDYDKLITQIGQHFEIVKVEGIPLGFLPVSLSFTVGIIARSKGQQ